jgi:hypothetical protein
MSDEKTPKTDAAAVPFVRLTPAETARSKKNRDARRIAIRSQNLRSKALK